MINSTTPVTATGYAASTRYGMSHTGLTRARYSELHTTPAEEARMRAEAARIAARDARQAARLLAPPPARGVSVTNGL